MPPTQKYPNAFAHPETALREDHVKDSALLQVEFCPIGMAITGPTCQVRVGGTLYDVIDMGTYPYTDWEVVPGVENTEDEDYDAGTDLYVVITGAAIRKILEGVFITRGDETDFKPNSVPLDEVSLEELGNRDHGFLTAVDPNQHHYQFHRHDDPLDSTELRATKLSASQVFELRGVITIPELTADQDNWFPADYTENTIWLLTTDATRIITGLNIAPNIGRLLYWVNLSTDTITLPHSDTGSTFHNRFLCAGNTDIVLGENDIVRLFHDGEQWRASAGGSGGGGGGVTDHGDLTGLGDDDHTQYELRSDLAPVAESGLLEDLTTAETDTALVLHPDGAGGVEWGVDSGGGGGGGGGSLVLVEQHTASSSAQLDFTTAISGTYDEYLFEFDHVIPAANAVALQMLMGTGGGPTFDTGGNYSWEAFVWTAAAFISGGSTGDTKLQLSYTTHVSNDANWGICGKLRMFDPGSAIYKQVNGDFHFYASDPARASVSIGGAYESATAVTAIRFLMSTGNIASGTIRCYGVAKS